jgi:hypothetical protein
MLAVAMTGHAAVDDTLGYTAALAVYVEDKLIGEKELERVITACDRGEIANPFTRKAAELHTAKWHAFETLEEWIESGQLDAAQVCAWAKKTHDAVKSQRGQRKSAQRDTKVAWNNNQETIGVGLNAACGVREDRRLVCWNREFELHAPANFGLVQTISVLGNNVCAVSEHGELRCFDIVSNGSCEANRTDEERIVCTLAESQLNLEIPLHQIGRVHSVVLSPLQTCVTTEELELVCWTQCAASSSNYTPAKINTKVKDVGWLYVGVVELDSIESKGFGIVIAVSLDGTARYFHPYGAGKNTKDIEPRMLAHDGIRNCYVDSGDNLKCEGTGPYAKPAHLQKARFIVGDMYSTDPRKSTCAISMEGQVLCWNHEREVLGHEGPAVRLAIREGNVCALLKNGGVNCWNLHDAELSSHEFQPPKNLKLLVHR